MSPGGSSARRSKRATLLADDARLAFRAFHDVAYQERTRHRPDTTRVGRDPASLLPHVRVQVADGFAVDTGDANVEERGACLLYTSDAADE